MLEVCSTTLPQQILPSVMSDDRYYPMLAMRSAQYQRRADEAHAILSTIPGVIIHKPNGAFYMTLVFEEGILTNTQTLAIGNAEVSAMVDALVAKDITNDKRFVYYLLASTGICVVPLTSGFNSSYDGFRFTLLEQDDARFTHILTTLKEAIVTYTGR